MSSCCVAMSAARTAVMMPIQAMTCRASAEAPTMKKMRASM